MDGNTILTAAELSERWKISARRISALCAEGRVAGAIKKGKVWLIPSSATKPSDLRISIAKEKKAPSSSTFHIQNRRYLGNKYKLLDFIEKTIQEQCGPLESLMDIFAGTGVVAEHFCQKMDVITNDILYSNYITHLAFMGTEQVDSTKIHRLIEKYNNLDASTLPDNYMSENFSNTYYSLEDCKKIGYVRDDIELLFDQGDIGARERAILITSLLYAMDRIANTCGHYDAYLRQGNFTKPLQIMPIEFCEDCTHQRLFYNDDANRLARSGRLPKVDVVYCDPPYNSRNYSDLYHLLENVATWKKPTVSGVARKMDRSALKSQYCSRRANLAFRELVENLRCKYILLSYNNTGTRADDRSNARISDNDIIQILSSRGDVEVFTTNYKAFSTGKSRNDTNAERLFLCRVNH